MGRKIGSARIAHIHHKDGNGANNPQDGSNWEVLCPQCHCKIPHDVVSDTGVYVHTIFAKWKKQEIIAQRDNVCERCGHTVTIGQYISKASAKCCMCEMVIPHKDQIIWQNGTIMCTKCFMEYEREVSGGNLTCHTQ